jgi:hypothetical protein
MYYSACDVLLSCVMYYWAVWCIIEMCDVLLSCVMYYWVVWCIIEVCDVLLICVMYYWDVWCIIELCDVLLSCMTYNLNLTFPIVSFSVKHTTFWKLALVLSSGKIQELLKKSTELDVRLDQRTQQTRLHNICIFHSNEANRYGLDGSGIEYRRGRDFPNPSTPALEPTQPSVQLVPGSYSGDKVAGAWRWPPTPIYYWGLNKIELLPHWAFMACSGVNLYTNESRSILRNVSAILAKTTREIKSAQLHSILRLSVFSALLTLFDWWL